MSEWYISHGGKTQGPFSEEQLKQLAKLKKIRPETVVRLGTEGHWFAAKDVKDLFEPQPRRVSAAKSAIAASQATVDVQSRSLPAELIDASPHHIATGPPASPPDSFGQTTHCPFCQEIIARNAKKCKHCGEVLDPVLKELRGGRNARYPPSPTEKRILPAFLLALFLGGFGAHRFYSGNTGSAVAMLVLTVVGLALIVPLIVVGIWVIIDLIMLASGSFRDGDGVTITEWT